MAQTRKDLAKTPDPGTNSTAPERTSIVFLQGPFQTIPVHSVFVGNAWHKVAQSYDLSIF